MVPYESVILCRCSASEVHPLY